MCGLAWGVRRPLQLEIADMREAPLLGRVTSVAINPLLFAFLTIVIVKVVEVL